MKHSGGAVFGAGQASNGIGTCLRDPVPESGRFPSVGSSWYFQHCVTFTVIGAGQLTASLHLARPSTLPIQHNSPARISLVVGNYRALRYQKHMNGVPSMTTYKADKNVDHLDRS